MDSTVKFIDLGRDDKKKKYFSFEAFEFVSKKGAEVYVHAEVQVCSGKDADK